MSPPRALLPLIATALACSTPPPAGPPEPARAARPEPPRAARTLPAVPDEPPAEAEDAPTGESPPTEWSLEVTATAYNSLPGQTWGDPSLAAWGDRLEPGMRALAVSRDLLELGLTHNTEVRIEGIPGTWTVLDKTHRRWRRRIDLYMGVDVKAARRFGKRTLRIYWTPPRDAAELAER